MYIDSNILYNNMYSVHEFKINCIEIILNFLGIIKNINLNIIRIILLISNLTIFEHYF